MNSIANDLTREEYDYPQTFWGNFRMVWRLAWIKITGPKIAYFGFFVGVLSISWAAVAIGRSIQAAFSLLLRSVQ